MLWSYSLRGRLVSLRRGRGDPETGVFSKTVLQPRSGSYFRAPLQGGFSARCFFLSFLSQRYCRLLRKPGFNNKKVKISVPFASACVATVPRLRFDHASRPAMV